MPVHLTPVDAADQRDLEAHYEIFKASRAVDVPDFPEPTLREIIGQARYPRIAEENYRFLGRIDGRAVALLEIGLPTADNLHMAGVTVTVHPEYRRQGVGRELFTSGMTFVRDRGRKVLMGMYVTGLPDGPPRDPGFAAFAAAVGAAPALTEIRRRLDLDTVDTAGWTDQLTAAQDRATGYTAVTWALDTPDDLVDEVARLEGRMILDMPIGELQLEQEQYDGARIRAMEENGRLRGRRLYQAGIRDDATGSLAAWTALTIDADVTTHAFQGTTIVDPDHRGHRLGALVKIANLVFTREQEPDLCHIHTWNAAENRHMIAINEELGFRPIDQWVNWQLDL